MRSALKNRYGRAALRLGLALTFATAATRCTGAEEAVPGAGKLAGEKIVMIVAPQKFRDEELILPREILTKQGADVKIASTSLDESKGLLGATVKPDVLVKDVSVADYDAVAFIGGPDAASAFGEAIARALVEKRPTATQ